MRPSRPTALTIAGSDSGGGAGLQADLKTFLQLHVEGMSAVTAITAQNSRGVRRVDPVPVEGLRAQLQAVLEDYPVHAIKIGMLGSEAHIRCVAEVLAPLTCPIVIDPVMASTSGHRLLAPEALHALATELIPRSTLVTPNHPELLALTHSGTLAQATASLADSACAWLVTGGDAPGASVVDTLWRRGERLQTWTHPRVAGGPFHGTGCTLSSGIAAGLARGLGLRQAITEAETYVHQRLTRTSTSHRLGAGSCTIDRRP